MIDKKTTFVEFLVICVDVYSTSTHSRCFFVDRIPVIACRRSRSYGLGMQQEPPTRFDSGVGASANEGGNHHPTADPCIQYNMRVHIFR